MRDTGRYGFALPANQIKPTGEETFNAVRALALGLRDSLRNTNSPQRPQNRPKNPFPNFPRPGIISADDVLDGDNNSAENNADIDPQYNYQDQAEYHP